jgi:hypothetical protein
MHNVPSLARRDAYSEIPRSETYAGENSSELRSGADNCSHVRKTTLQHKLHLIITCCCEIERCESRWTSRNRRCPTQYEHLALGQWWRSPTYVTGTKIISNIMNRNKNLHRNSYKILRSSFLRNNDVNSIVTKHYQDGSTINHVILEYERPVTD